MTLADWDLVARIAGPVLGAFVGWGLARASERRSKLVTYYGHVSAFQIRPPAPEGGGAPPPPFPVHAHAVVIRNAGRKAATGVRVSHAVMPRDFTISPATPYTVEELEGSTDIVIPQLVPKEQITISYMYPSHILWNQVTQGVKCDDGFADVLHVLPTPQPAKWAWVLTVTLLAVGGITVLYLAVKATVFGWTRLNP